MESLVIYTYKPHLTNAQKEELGREARFRAKLTYDTRQWVQNLEAVEKGVGHVQFLHLFMQSLDKSQQELFDYLFRDLRDGFPESPELAKE